MKLEKVTPKAAKDTTQTEHTSAPESSDEMAMDKEQSDDHSSVHSEDPTGRATVVRDSTVNCPPAGQARDGDQPSCCVKKANHKKFEALTKHN
jgi:hypothetical protein